MTTSFSSLVLAVFFAAAYTSVALGAPVFVARGGDGASERWEANTAGRSAISLAGGEYEMLEVRLQNDDKHRIVRSWEIVWDDDEVASSRIYRHAAASDYAPGAPESEDALVVLSELALRPNAHADMLVEFMVPANSNPGAFGGEIRAVLDEGDPVRHRFVLEIWDFDVQENSGLAAFFPLDIAALQREGVKAELRDLDAWTRYYDALSTFPFAYRLDGPVSPPVEGLDQSGYQAHVKYVASSLSSIVADVGGRPGSVGQLALPTALAPQDPAQSYFLDILQGIRGIGTTVMPIVQADTVGERLGWHSVRQNYARVGRADKRIQRIIVGPPHPHFESYAEIWALPEDVPKALLGLLSSGRSLVQYLPPPGMTCVGTVGEPDPTGTYQTLASEAVDGCEATRWMPVPSGGQTPWLELTFEHLTPVRSLTILGENLSLGEGLMVETAYRPGVYTRATVEWTAHGDHGYLGTPAYRGQFKVPRECRQVRLSFSAANAKGPVSIAEILLDSENIEAANNFRERVSPWLDLTRNTHPAWQPGPDSRLESARGLPWYCWSKGAEGFIGPALNGTRGVSPPLLATGTDTLLPTRRLFALRDGLEDYEYLKLFWGRVLRNEIQPPRDFRPGTGIETEPGSLEGARARLQMREKLGRLLSGESLVTRNFGPAR